MRTKQRIAAVAALVLTVMAAPAVAQTTTVDFSGYSAGAAIGNSYSALGLSFSPNVVFATCAPGGCPAADINGAFAFAGGAQFSAFFATAQSSVSFQSVSYGSANGFASSIFAQAYDSTGTAIGAGVTVNDYGADDTIYTLEGAGIARIDFDYGHGTNGPAITDLTFAAPPAVPEPAAWAMMVAGFGTLGVSMRRHRRVATRLSYAA